METNEKTVEKEREGNVITFILQFKKIVIVAFIGVLVIVLALSVLFAKDRDIITITESSLKEAVEESELSTVEFIYNSTVAALDEKNKPKYYVAYEGTVKAGFDFNGIATEIDKVNKKIVIIIPEIKINSVNINDKTLDFIFVKDKYDTETTFQEAYKISYSDLEYKAEANVTIKDMAYENAVDSMKAIIMPLVAELPEGYSFDFKRGE